MAASLGTNSYSNYDVFLNHRGPDVKKTLASHLFRSLKYRGFRVFFDESEMQEGQNITSQIEGAIAAASVHIAIFSKGYAESKWCMNELLLMLKSKGTVIPVFYHVEPCDLRIRTVKNGVYAKAIQIHEMEKRYDEQKIADWIEALSDASSLSGLELKSYNGDEGKLVDRVLQLVEDKVRKPPLDVAKYPVGLEEKLQDFENTVLLHQRHSCKTKVVGIVGTAGVGKTTLAIEFFNRKRSAYHQSCFLQDVRTETLVSLQKELYQGLTSLELGISSILDGRRKLSHRLSGSKALIILDNVDRDNQLDALFEPLKDVLDSDSLILITSRNQDVLSRIENPPIYKMTGLDKEHSRQLFCLHAFHKPQSEVEFEEVVSEFLDVCDGLPLSVEVLGSKLYQKDLEYWKEQLLKISDALVLPPDIQDSLKISYESLDREEREIFLDIACFFIEKDRDLAIRIWGGSGWRGRLNLQNLVDKSILEIDGKNCIRMHNQLRDFGRDYSEKELPRCDRRLWRPSDSLSHNADIQPRVRGITRVQETSGQSIHNPVELGNLSVDMTKLHLLKAEGDCLGSISEFLRHADQLQWLCWNQYPHTSLPSWFQTKNLRVLQVDGCQFMKTLWKSESEAPLKLEHFEMKYIVEMKDAIEPLPEDFCHLRALKHLRLQTRMMSLPDSFGNLTNLRHIDFSGCVHLRMLPESFWDLRDVEHIILNGCLSLEMLPPCLRKLPPCLRKLPQLRRLDLPGTRIKKIDFPEGFCPNLQHLNLCFCDELVEVGALPTTLISLDLHQCSLLEKITDSFQNLTNLRHIDFSGCIHLRMLPESFWDLRDVEHISLNGCLSLEMLQPCLRRLPQLRRLDLQRTRINKIEFPEGFCPNLQHLNLCFCDELVEVGALPATLISLDLHQCYLLEKITGLSGLAELRLLDVSGCNEMEEPLGLETLSSLPSLKELKETFECKKLTKSLRSFEHSDAPEIPDPSLGREIHKTFDGTEASTETSGSLLVYASPPRHSVGKGRVYMRRSTHKKIEAAHGHGVTEPMVPKLMEENLASMLDATVDAASTMAASHTEALAVVVPAPPVSTTVEEPAAGAHAPHGSTTVETMPPTEEAVPSPPSSTSIDVQPTAPSTTQGTESQLSPYVVESPTPVKRRLDLGSPWPPPRPTVRDPSMYNDPRDKSGGSSSEKGKRKRDS